jgi:pimeloyl-ACP methyl ester carboxylesterase
MPSFDSSGVRIHYVDEGSGPPVVLVHGLTSNIEKNWRRPGTIDALLASGMRVVALDCRGHGESEKPHAPEAYSGTKMGDDVVALIDHLGIDVTDLVGYSMGGAIAASLLARRPDRFRRVVIAGVGDWVLRTLDDTERPGAGRGRSSGPLRRMIRRWLLQRMARRLGNDPEALAAMRAAARGRLDVQKLAEVRCPVLILVGRQDRGAGSPDKLAAAIPGSQAVKVPGGHITAVVDPAFKRAIVDFLTR